MKKPFTMPKIIVEQFVPNEYVSACGDIEVTYTATCNVGNGDYGQVYLETNGVAGLQTEVTPTALPDHTKGHHAACFLEIETSNKNEFCKGYFLSENSSGYGPIYVWTGPNGRENHCTWGYTRNEKETAKS